MLLLLLRCPVCDGPCSAGRFLPKSILTRTPSYTPYPGSGYLLPLDRRVRGNRRPSQRRLQVRHREASLPRRVQVLQRDVPCTTAGGTRVGTLSTLNHQPQTPNPKPQTRTARRVAPSARSPDARTDCSRTTANPKLNAKHNPNPKAQPPTQVPEALDEQPQGLLGQGQARLVQRRDHLRWILFHRRLLFQPPYVALLSQSST